LAAGSEHTHEQQNVENGTGLHALRNDDSFANETVDTAKQQKKRRTKGHVVET